MQVKSCMRIFNRFMNNVCYRKTAHRLYMLIFFCTDVLQIGAVAWMNLKDS